MKKLNVLLLSTLMASSVIADPVEGTITFNVGEASGCTPQTEDFVCPPITAYYIYSAGSTVALGEDSEAIPFAIEAGVKYCFEAASFNGVYSLARAELCRTWSVGTPNPPTSLTFKIVFGVYNGL